MDIKIKEKEIKKYFGLLAECKNRVELLEGLKEDEVYFKENDAIKIVNRKDLLKQTKEDIIELELLIYAKLCQIENKK